MNKKTKMLIQEISRLSDKLEDNRLAQEEKLTLTALKKEKIEEFRKICKSHLETSEPEYKPETREEREDKVPVVDTSFWRYIRDKYR